MSRRLVWIGDPEPLVWRSPASLGEISVDLITDDSEALTDDGEQLFVLGGTDTLQALTPSSRIVWVPSAGNRVVIHNDEGA